ncbi:MAG: RHS repeat-associated core domain-containing protein, partial [Planctomycetes bacterium]|nr:RHS repeat-associated core domain-containing protein [Planctomycetota bacterium]
YQTGAANRMTSDGVYTYSYDAEGNRTKKTLGASADTWTFGYDNNDRMTWAEDRATDGGSLQLKLVEQYDVYGRRIEEDRWTAATGTVVLRLGYDDSRDVWADLDGSNALQTRYVRLDGPDALAARESGAGTVGWYGTDREGSVRLNLSASGALLNRTAYDAYGSITSQSAPASADRFAYTGAERQSDLGYQLHDHRWYDTRTGRWTTEDPKGFDAGDYHLGRYLGNSPTNGTDPSGLDEIGSGIYNTARSILDDYLRNIEHYVKNGKPLHRHLERVFEENAHRIDRRSLSNEDARLIFWALVDKLTDEANIRLGVGKPAPDITSENRLGPGDLVVLLKNRAYEGNQDSNWEQARDGKGMDRELNGRGSYYTLVTSVSSEAEFRKVLEQEVKKRNGRPFKRILVIGHCGGVGDTDVGPSIDFGQGRVTSKNINPKTIQAIQRALAVDGAFVIGTCGYYQDSKVDPAKWLAGLERWAEKLDRQVYADQVTSHSDPQCGYGSRLDPFKQAPGRKRQPVYNDKWDELVRAGLVIYRRASAPRGGRPGSAQNGIVWQGPPLE